MEQIPSRESNSSSGSQEIPRLYTVRRFITVLTYASQWTLSRVKMNTAETCTPFLQDPF
jgi:hypothetical protein